MLIKLVKEQKTLGNIYIYIGIYCNVDIIYYVINNMLYLHVHR